MAPPPRDRRIRQAPALAVFVFAALGFGVAAALLIGPAAPSAGGTPLFGQITVATAGWISLGVVVAIFAGTLIANRGEGKLDLGPAVVVFLGIFAMLVILLVLISLVHPSGGTGTGGLGPPTNDTTPPSSNGTPPAGGPAPGVPPWSPGWIPWIFLGVAAVTVGLILVPLLVRRAEPDLETPTDEESGRRAGLLRALHDLDSDPGADPRQRIIALYGQLLARVAPKLDALDSLTAREVARTVLLEWRVPESAARTLTDLFEEARYSQHPMTEASVEKARKALTETLAAIDRPKVAI